MQHKISLWASFYLIITSCHYAAW